VRIRRRVKELFTQRYRGFALQLRLPPRGPNMSDQEKTLQAPEPERIGCTLTENWQIDPEQAPARIIRAPPEAKYFNV
jgi:5-methyltetrahydrofolate--homocysteine methyltransferase